MNMFRALRADEIDCRISQMKDDGLSLLLYKDARCDQNILDEVVGPYNWKREHTRDNRNCVVSLWDEGKGQWISKEDTGTESNTEREKGLASDSFKRACFNWGIGRELYTAPFIFIKKGDYTTAKNGKCYDRFTVDGITTDKGVIVGLQIKNQKLNKIVYKWGKVEKADKAPDRPQEPDTEPASVPAAVNTDVPAKVEEAKKLPEEGIVSEAEKYLKGAIKTLRELRGISIKENNDLFKHQFETLKKAGIAPDKTLKEYTLEEAQALIDAMYKNFSPEGTEIKK